jgi:hypothetical protein
MKKYFYLFLTILVMMSQVQAKTWGLGAVFGAPTGLSADYFFKTDRVLHTTLAYQLNGRSEIEIASHYEWRKAYRELNWFYGAGAKVHADHAGPSGSLGIFHDFKEAPIEIFLKTVLTLNIISETSSDLDLMLGIHYQF